MFCSECGVKAAGKFCWSCGSALQQSPMDDAALAPVDWPTLTEYAAIMRVPEVRERIARAAAQAKKRLSGEQFLEICDKFMSPLSGGVSLTAIASIAEPLAEKLNLKCRKVGSRRFNQPVGTMIVAVLCSLARNGQHLQDVTQEESGCRLEASLPSDVWSLRGKFNITVRDDGVATLVEAEATIKGQIYDWGKGQRLVDQLFNEVSALAKAA